MSRRKRHEDPENHERWLVSYADFITLLFAFFVVMYSISSLNEGKYQQLSQSLEGIFKQDQATQVIPIGDEPARAIVSPPIGSGAGAATTPVLETITQRLQEALQSEINSGQLKLHGNETWLEIELNSNLLFLSGDALPNNSAFALIESIAHILAPYQNPVRVEGYTDNQPISTALYPSNWELSAARAACVVRMLATYGLNPRQLSAVGYGEFQPVADNSTPEGRASNRRVVLAVSRDLDIQRLSSGAVGTQSAK